LPLRVSRHFSPPGNLSSEKIDRCTYVWTKKPDLRSVKKGAAAGGGQMSFITVQNFSHLFAEYPKDLDSYEPRLLDDPRISVLKE
jgi:hypothetical protein